MPTFASPKTKGVGFSAGAAYRRKKSPKKICGIRKSDYLCNPKRERGSPGDLLRGFVAEEKDH